MKKIIPLLLSLFLFTLLLINCEKEEISHIEQVLSTEKFHSRRISGSKIPNIINLINKETKNVLTTKSSSSTNYGELDLEDIVEVIDTIGNINYSFRISNIDDDGFSLYNLVVHTDEDGNTNAPYVVKYTMEEDFANAYYANTIGFGEFTGTISRYTIDTFLSSHSTKYAKDIPVLDCPCDETSIENGGNDTGDTGNSGSGSNDPDGNPTSGTGNGTSGGGFSPCTLIIVATPCSCPGNHTSWYGCTCIENGGAGPSFATEYDCSAKSFQQKGSDDCPQDTNGNCPEDDGYVGVNTARIVIDPISFEHFPCQKEIVDSIYNNKSELSNFIMSAFGGDQNKVNLTYKMGTPKDPDTNLPVDGYMDPDYDSNSRTLDAEIVIDSTMAKNATDLYIATITIHENLHAILAYAILINNLTTSPNPDLYELAITYAEWRTQNDPSTDEHAFMATMVGEIAKSLKEYGESKGYDLLDSYYDDLSWSGEIGFNNDTFAGLPFEKKRAIRNALDNERNPDDNGSSPSGNKCQ